jgi:hypothetical protein
MFGLHASFLGLYDVRAIGNNSVREFLNLLSVEDVQEPVGIDDTVDLHECPPYAMFRKVLIQDLDLGTYLGIPVFTEDDIEF